MDKLPILKTIAGSIAYIFKNLKSLMILCWPLMILIGGVTGFVIQHPELTENTEFTFIHILLGILIFLIFFVLYASFQFQWMKNVIFNRSSKGFFPHSFDSQFWHYVWRAIQISLIFIAFTCIVGGIIFVIMNSVSQPSDIIAFFFFTIMFLITFTGWFHINRFMYALYAAVDDDQDTRLSTAWKMTRGFTFKFSFIPMLTYAIVYVLTLLVIFPASLLEEQITSPEILMGYAFVLMIVNIISIFLTAVAAPTAGAKCYLFIKAHRK